MDSLRWVHHFEANRCRRPEPAWGSNSPLSDRTRAALARSLSHFQLGESGEGAVLFRHAARAYPHDAGYRSALALFVAEEQEHARLLERLVRRLGGEPVTHHWSHACFRVLRHSLGLHFELQTLAAAEIIGAAYYGMLAHRSGDPVVDEVCALMMRDEPPHLEFHRQRLEPSGGRRRGALQRLWSLQFRLFTAAASGAAWVDHRGALRAVGVRRAEFLAEASTLSRRFTRPMPAPKSSDEAQRR